jgi:hypothetical protein
MRGRRNSVINKRGRLGCEHVFLLFFVDRSPVVARPGKPTPGDVVEPEVGLAEAKGEFGREPRWHPAVEETTPGAGHRPVAELLALDVGEAGHSLLELPVLGLLVVLLAEEEPRPGAAPGRQGEALEEGTAPRLLVVDGVALDGRGRELDGRWPREDPDSRGLGPTARRVRAPGAALQGHLGSSRELRLDLLGLVAGAALGWHLAEAETGRRGLCRLLAPRLGFRRSLLLVLLLLELRLELLLLLDVLDLVEVRSRCLLLLLQCR